MNVTRQCSTTPIDPPTTRNRRHNEETVSSSTFVSLRNVGEMSRSSRTKQPPAVVSKGRVVGTAAVDSTTNTGSSQKLQQLKASLRDQRRRYQKSSLPPPPKCIMTTRTSTGSSTVSVDGTTSGQSSSSSTGSSGSASRSTKSHPTGGDAATVTTAESTVMIDHHGSESQSCSPSSSTSKPHSVSSRRRHDMAHVGISPLSCHTTSTTMTPTSRAVPSPQRHWHSSIHVPNLESPPSSFDQDDDKDDDDDPSSVATPPTLDDIYASMEEETTILAPNTMTTFAVDSPNTMTLETTDYSAGVASECPTSTTNTRPLQSNVVTPQQEPNEPRRLEWATPKVPTTTTATRMEDTLSSELSMETSSSSSPTLSLSEFLRLDIDDDDDDNLCDYTTHSDTSGWASLGDSTAGPLGGGSDSQAVGDSPIRATTTPKLQQHTTGTTTTPSWMVDRTRTATLAPPKHVKPKSTVTFQIETIEVKTAKSLVPIPPKPERPLPRANVQQLRKSPVGGSSSRRREVHTPKPLFVTARRADELCRAQGGHLSLALRCGMILLPQPAVEDCIPLVPSTTIRTQPPTLNVRLSTDFRCGTYGSLYDIAMRSVSEGNSIVAKARPDDASIGSYRSKATERKSCRSRVVVRTTSTTTRNMGHPPRPPRTTPTNRNTTTTRPVSNTTTTSTLGSSQKLRLRPPPSSSSAAALPRRNRTIPSITIE